MIAGWDDIPIGFGAIFNFDLAPLWLKALSRTPFVERFAYPIALRKGLGTLRKIPVLTCMCNPPCSPPVDRHNLNQSVVSELISRGWNMDTSRPTLLDLADLGFYPYSRLISKSEYREFLKNPIRRFVNFLLGFNPALMRGYFTREGMRRARFKYNRSLMPYLADMYYDQLV